MVFVLASRRGPVRSALCREKRTYGAQKRARACRQKQRSKSHSHARLKGRGFSRNVARGLMLSPRRTRKRNNSFAGACGLPEEENARERHEALRRQDKVGNVSHVVRHMLIVVYASDGSFEFHVISLKAVVAKILDL